MRPRMRNRYLFLADIVLTMLAAWTAFVMRFGWLFASTRTDFLPLLIIAVVVKLATFYAFGLYRRYWRYAGYWDLVAVVLANSAASAILMTVMVGILLMGWIPYLSRSVLALDWLLAVTLTIGVRASVRAVAETIATRPRNNLAAGRHVLIVGAGDAGALVAREMQKNPQLGLRPIGFLDDARDKAQQQIYGLPVLGKIAQFAQMPIVDKG